MCVFVCVHSVSAHLLFVCLFCVCLCVHFMSLRLSGWLLFVYLSGAFCLSVCLIKTFNILFIDYYCYAYVKLAIVISRVRVQV